MNKTTTFKEVFSSAKESDKLLYYKLPEKTTAQKIYKLRKLNGLTQKKFAEITGVGFSCISKYELGYKPSNKNLIKIMNKFNLSFNYLK
ncbi:transcriptional regulator [Clostridium septicum]|uniref:Transcriptional regulator n=1 Tax=Clostridium septicum TaxID=1504 RepID=A0A9N7PKP3_CLOSE|nr:transcriptional regulator [Clostridium septicum]